MKREIKKEIVILKKLLLSFVILLVLTLCGCGSAANTEKSPESETAAFETSTAAPASESQADSGITPEKAEGILKDYLLTQGISVSSDPGLRITLDRTDEADGQKYFVFQVFDDMEDHVSTLGWYGVQKDDGSLYDFVGMTPIDQTAPESSASEDFTYDIESRNWNDGGITVKYPMLVNSDNQDSADKINELIMNDMTELLNELADIAADDTFTFDGVFEYTTPDPSNFDKPVPKALSVFYLITYSSDSLAHPVNIYHTVSISQKNPAVIALSDLFSIDDSFVDSFLMGSYIPYRDDLDLEASGVIIQDFIKEQYTTRELVKIFSIENASYYLTNQGIVLSVPVTHAAGDHLEMAVSYEFLESEINKDHPFWDGYMFLSE
jgi:hypothetical protein